MPRERCRGDEFYPIASDLDSLGRSNVVSPSPNCSSVLYTVQRVGLVTTSQIPNSSSFAPKSNITSVIRHTDTDYGSSSNSGGSANNGVGCALSSSGSGAGGSSGSSNVHRHSPGKSLIIIDYNYVFRLFVI